MHSGHRVLSSVAPLVLPLLHPCKCLSNRIRHLNAVCPFDVFVGIGNRAASSMVLSLYRLPLMLSHSLSARCWLGLSLCKLVINPFKAIGCLSLSSQYHFRGMSNPLMMACEVTVTTSRRIPPSAMSSRSPSASLSARKSPHSNIY